MGVTPSLFPFFNGGFKTPRCRFQGQTDAAGAARRIQFQPDLEAGIQLEEDATDRERERALCDRVWHVHRLSPLFGIGSAPREPDDPAAATDSESDDFNREKVVGAFKAELQRTLEEQHRGILDQVSSNAESRDIFSCPDFMHMHIGQKLWSRLRDSSVRTMIFFSDF